MRNDRLEPEVIAKAGFSTVAHEAQHALLLLAVEDMTTLSYSHEANRVLGPIGNRRESNVGVYLAHSVLLLDATREATVGLIDQALWARDGVHTVGSISEISVPTRPSKASNGSRHRNGFSSDWGPAMARTISI